MPIATGTALLISALIGAVGSIAGGAIGAQNQGDANKANIQLQQMANEASAIEAQKNRDWQQMMSNTAHQREVADLKAAGLNPWLSVSGSGAATGSGATASQSAASVQSLGDYNLSSLASLAQSLAFISALKKR